MVTKPIDAPGINLDLEQLDDSAMIYRGVLTPEQCDEIITRSADHGHKTIDISPGCKISGGGIEDVAQIHPAEQLVYAMFRDTIAELGWDLEHAEISRFAVSRYQVGMCMGEHVDDEERGPQAAWNVQHRGVSMSIPLSESGTYSGGRLRLRTNTGEWYYPELGRGDAFCFGSSRPHEVTKVTDGERWVLLAWCYVNHNLWDCR